MAARRGAPALASVVLLLRGTLGPPSLAAQASGRPASPAASAEARYATPPTWIGRRDLTDPGSASPDPWTVSSGYVALRRVGPQLVVRYLGEDPAGAGRRTAQTRRFAVADLARSLRRDAPRLDAFAAGTPALVAQEFGGPPDTSRVTQAALFSGAAALRFTLLAPTGHPLGRPAAVGPADAIPADSTRGVYVWCTLPEGAAAGGAVLPLPEFRRFLADLRGLTGAGGATRVPSGPATAGAPR